MTRKIMFLLMALSLIVGCSKENNKAGETAPGSGGADISSILPETGIDSHGLDPTAVLVEVDGVKLTSADTELELEYRIASIKDRLTPDRLAAARDQVRRTIVEQFIMKQLLLNEANRLDITVTKEDEEKAFEQIKDNLPPGMTLEQVMKESPIGEERMHEEVITGIKINKLFEQRIPSEEIISEEEIASFHEQYKDSMTSPETVHARHILVSIQADDTEETKAEKRKIAEMVQNELVNGGDFTELAKQYSDCPSKEKGGDLGTFPRDRMVAEFSEAAFSQELNAIGPIVETKYGYHIIQTLEHNEAENFSRERIEELLKNNKQQVAMREFIEDLKSKAKINYGPGVMPPPPINMPMGMDN